MTVLTWCISWVISSS